MFPQNYITLYISEKYLALYISVKYIELYISQNISTSAKRYTVYLHIQKKIKHFLKLFLLAYHYESYYINFSHRNEPLKSGQMSCHW